MAERAMTGGTRSAVVPALKFGGLFAVLWVVFYSVYAGLPYIRPGNRVMYEAKARLVRRGQLFSEDAKGRLIIVGDSRTTAGFVPALFDSLSSDRFRSYNLGYNLGIRHLDRLLFTMENLVDRGQAPSHVLTVVLWVPGESRETWAGRMGDSAYVRNTLFPFRRLPRDLVLFGLRSRFHGGPRAFYRHGRQAVEQMLSDRGYYFIESQSHYPGHRLPEEFRLESDEPNHVECRVAKPSGYAFRRLMEIGEAHDIHYYIVPTYYRQGQYARPPARNVELASALSAFPRMHVVGPDYCLLPNKYFSDVTHLNPEGARVYTAKLWEVFREATNGHSLGRSGATACPPGGTHGAN